MMNVRTWQGTLRNKEPEAHESMDWFDLNTLPDTLIPIHRHVLAMMRTNIPYSEYCMPIEFFEKNTSKQHSP